MSDLPLVQRALVISTSDHEQKIQKYLFAKQAESNASAWLVSRKDTDYITNLAHWVRCR